ncbi:MAG: ATP-binding protein [Myxococcales bacterium]|nr:ATP-binding protein [Myxococcales bacterium]
MGFQERLSALVNAVEAQLAARPGVQTDWAVLTGPPGSGKSTLLEALGALGHRVQTEAARAIIEQALACGQSLEDLTRDTRSLAMTILERNELGLAQLPTREHIVLDRSLGDVLAFAFVDGVDWQALVAPCSRFRFRIALLCESIPDARDATTYHSPPEIARLAVACERVYRALGAEVVRIPAIAGGRQAAVAERLALARDALIKSG